MPRGARECAERTSCCVRARFCDDAPMLALLAVFEQFEEWVSSDWSYLVIFTVATLDAFFPVVPSESVAIAGGVLAGAGELSLPLVILAASAGAILGDNISYGIGNLVGERTVKRVFSGDKSRKGFEWAERQLEERGTLPHRGRPVHPRRTDGDDVRGRVHPRASPTGGS